MSRAVAALVTLTTIGLAASARAQEKYPTKPIQVVIPLSAGTTADIVTRVFADKLSQRLGQSLVVQNRPGAGGTIGSEAGARAAPDGYTILAVNSQHSINPFVMSKLTYDTLRDFVGIALIAEAPALVAVNPKLGVTTLAQFIALAKQRPGSINYGSAGIGTATHLAGAYFANRANIEMVHVPYKTGNDILADLVSGRIEVTFSPVAFLLPNVREGKVLALAITSPEPSKTPLDVPSASDAGPLPNFAYSTWYGFVAPAKTPRTILDRLAQEMKAVSEDKDVRERFAGQGIQPRAILLAEFDAYIKADMEKIEPLIKQSGAKTN